MTARGAWLKLQTIRADMKATFKQRDDVVDGALVALLAGHHVLLLGPPGTAKSELARTLCGSIHDARFFECCLNKFITWRDLACPQTVIRERVDGDTKTIDFRYLEGALLGAHIVFLDEIYELSASTAKSLLPWLNERSYSINAGEVGRAPLVTAVAASNDMPDHQEQFDAFSDRFLLRFDVAYLSISQGTDTAFLEMLAGTIAPPSAALTLTELTELRSQAAQVRIPPSARGLMNSIRATLKLQHGIEPSDRRYKHSLDALKAQAWLDGHDVVEPGDLGILQHILWSRRDHKEQEAVRQVVRESIGAPGLGAATELLQEAARVHREAATKLDEASRLLPFDEARRRERDRCLREAAARERRLDEISHTLDQQLETYSGGAMGAGTLRTIRNEVNVLRKALVQKRGIENPFMQVEQWTEAV